VDNLNLAGLGAARSFLLVAPDMDDSPACPTCVWTDGRNGLGVAAETYLLAEVVPLVERLFNVGTGRGSRALLGTSMGATGALIQGFRHPDRFGLVGAMSPLLDLASHPVTDRPVAPDAGARYDAYLLSQGLRPRGGVDIDYRNLSPLELAPQVIAANVEVVITALFEEGTGNERAAARLAELGLPHTYFSHGGARFTSDGALFRSHVFGALLRTFDEPLPTPAVFSYKSADRAFSVWGYDFTVTRQNTEFLNVLGARADGSDFILAGTGDVAVRTPRAFTPGQRYQVTMTPDQRTEDPRDPGQKLAPSRPRQIQATADARGRLAFPVELRPSRVLDEPGPLSWFDAGWVEKFEFPHVRVEIAPLRAESVDPSTGTPWLWKDTLPAPFAGWNVSVSPWPGNPQVLTVDFDSPALRLRARSYVALPDSYLKQERAFPVLYFVHGTVDGAPPQSGKWQSYNMGFQKRSALARSQYVVVSVDMGDASWCQYCWWIDSLHPKSDTIPGRNDTTGPHLPPADAEKHLYSEVIPLVEAMFRVRTDRGGRGIIGNSMGGAGAVTNGFRHPDTFAFVGGLSGYLYDVSTLGSNENSIYFDRQGYPSRYEGEVWYRNISPFELGSHLPGTDVEVLVSAGDGCVDPVNADNYCIEDVVTDPPSTDPLLTVVSGGYVEKEIRSDNDRASRRWAEVGAAHTFATMHGIHYKPDGEVYESWYLDRINRKFASTTVDPFRFSYKSAFRSFTAWGYGFAVDRPNDEFLNVLGARLDGRSFTLAGTGRVTVTTPPTLKGNHSYRVRITDASGAVREAALRSDGSGRLTLPVTLGAERTEDERNELIDAGRFAFPTTHVELLEPRDI